MSTQDVWADALKEAENPEQRNAGLWARSFAEADGDEAKARAAYIKAKVGGANAQTTTPAPQFHSDRGWCPVCHDRLDLEATYCSSCTSNLTARGLTTLKYRPTGVSPISQPVQQERQVIKTAKSRGVYIILGLFLGMLGIHNFYAGRYLRGALQMIITVTLGWFVIGLVISCFWALIDLFTVTTDGAGDAMA